MAMAAKQNADSVVPSEVERTLDAVKNKAPSRKAGAHVGDKLPRTVGKGFTRPAIHDPVMKENNTQICVLNNSNCPSAKKRADVV